MIRIFALLMLCTISGAASAISPYIYGDKVSGENVQTIATSVEEKLKTAGFKIVGKYFPKKLSTHGVVIATHNALLKEVSDLGGNAVLAAAIRVGVKSDGTVSYTNPDYWHRAYFRKNFAQAESTSKSMGEKLAKALGKENAFGGNESAAKLADYRYMVGMERLDSHKNKLAEHESYAEAVKSVRDNLAKNVGNAAKIYEITIPEKKIAVFGVATGEENTWLKAIQMEESIAALPYEVFVINGEVHSLHGRYRLALAFPDVGMGEFMRISSVPKKIIGTMTSVAGGKNDEDEANSWQ